MTDESDLQLTPKDGGSLTLSKARSGLIARGRRDAEALIAPVEAESEDERSGIDGKLDFTENNRSTEELLQDAEKGNAKSQGILAVYYDLWSMTGLHGEKASKAAEAVKWYRKAADQGYAPAQFNLGWLHDVNISRVVPVVVQDYAEAAKWYRRAAKHGYAPAEFSLGTMYDKGEGVPQDYSEAVKWYREAANQGYASAQFNLGLKYDKGEGVSQDYSEAVTWYREAANQGNPSAQFSLGMKFNSGQGVARDYVQAYLWMDLAAAHAGSDDRQRYAAIGERVAAKMTPSQIAQAQLLAARWYRKAADQGKAWDQFNLGVMYDKGEGVEQDYAEAAKWYRKAADQGHEEAQFNLGLKYNNGQGVVKDLVQAHMWMTLAAAPDYSGKDKSYAAMRDRVAANMTPSQIAEAQRLARDWKRIDATQPAAS